eukprot:SAG31_NODE_22827_length_517_cov_0.746411_1_plen_64_part_00
MVPMGECGPYNADTSSNLRPPNVPVAQRAGIESAEMNVDNQQLMRVELSTSKQGNKRKNHQTP